MGASYPEKKKDQQGKEIDVPWYDYVEGFTVQPNRFPSELKARSEVSWKLVLLE